MSDPDPRFRRMDEDRRRRNGGGAGGIDPRFARMDSAKTNPDPPARRRRRGVVQRARDWLRGGPPTPDLTSEQAEYGAGRMLDRMESFLDAAELPYAPAPVVAPTRRSPRDMLAAAPPQVVEPDAAGTRQTRRARATRQATEAARGRAADAQAEADRYRASPVAQAEQAEARRLRERPGVVRFMDQAGAAAAQFGTLGYRDEIVGALSPNSTIEEREYESSLRDLSASGDPVAGTGRVLGAITGASLPIGMQNALLARSARLAREGTRTRSALESFGATGARTRYGDVARGVAESVPYDLAYDYEEGEDRGTNLAIGAVAGGLAGGILRPGGGARARARRDTERPVTLRTEVDEAPVPEVPGFDARMPAPEEVRAAQSTLMRLDEVPRAEWTDEMAVEYRDALRVRRQAAHAVQMRDVPEPVVVDPRFAAMDAATIRAEGAPGAPAFVRPGRSGAAATLPADEAALVERARADAEAVRGGGTAPERIVAAAWRSSDDEVFQGANHGIAEEAMRAAGKRGSTATGETFGFVTSTGRFVTEDEARTIARAAGQPADGPRLTSERLGIPQPSAATYGRESSVAFPDGGSVRARYRLMEADEVQPSHHPVSFQRNPNYPEGVQGRDYHRDVAAQERVAERTTGFEPERLLDRTDLVVTGPPLVTRAGVAVAGNERAMLRRRIGEMNPQAEAAYRARLEERAADFGFTPEQVRGMRNPVLVRELADDVDDRQALAALNARSDQEVGKVKDELSDAATRARTFARATRAADHFAQTFDGESTLRAYLATPDGRQFVRELVQDGVIPRAEMPRYMDPRTGVLNAEGASLVERMMRLSAVPDADVVAAAPASIMAKVEGAAPYVVQSARIPGWDLGPMLRDAVRFHVEARANGAKVADHLDTLDMFGREGEMGAEALARFLDTASARQVRELFAAYSRQAAAAQRASESVDLFGYTPPTPLQAGAASMRRVLKGETVPVTVAPATPAADEAYQRQRKAIEDQVAAGLLTREDANKRLKGLGMRRAAARRQETGELTNRERAAVNRHEASNYQGKAITVQTPAGPRAGTVEGQAFGKVRVRLGDGSVIRVDVEQITPGRVLGDRTGASGDAGRVARLRQTDTPEFRRWFGDSKVVDDSGRPLVVYHGTRGDFNVFQSSRGGEYGSGIYLTPDEGAAWKFAEWARGDGDPSIMPVYVRLRNPYIANERNAVRSVSTKKLKERGYDGIIGIGPTGERQYVVFDPEQVKSATGNSGAFDPNNPDIRGTSEMALVNLIARIGAGAVAGGAAGGAIGGNDPEGGALIGALIGAGVLGAAGPAARAVRNRGGGIPKPRRGMVLEVPGGRVDVLGVGTPRGDFYRPVRVRFTPREPDIEPYEGSIHWDTLWRSAERKKILSRPLNVVTEDGPYLGTRVADERGRPKVVYMNEGPVFPDSRRGILATFAPGDIKALGMDEGFGPGYHFSEDAGAVVGAGEPARVIIRNPFRDDVAIPVDEARLLWERGGVVDRYRSGGRHDVADKLEEWMAMGDVLGSQGASIPSNGVWTHLRRTLGADGASRVLREAGYDGITSIGYGEKGPHRIWVAFEEGQVRPAPPLHRLFGNERGAAERALVGQVATAGVGALGGAALEPDNPLFGALKGIGALSGATLAIRKGRVLASGRKWRKAIRQGNVWKHARQFTDEQLESLARRYELLVPEAAQALRNEISDRAARKALAPEAVADRELERLATEGPLAPVRKRTGRALLANERDAVVGAYRDADVHLRRRIMDELEAAADEAAPAMERAYARLIGDLEMEHFDPAPSMGVTLPLRTAEPPLAPAPMPSRTAGAPIDPAQHVNLAKFALDSTGERRLAAHVRRAVEDEGLDPKRVVTWDETKSAARELGLEPEDVARLAKSSRRLTAAELLAVRNLVRENVQGIETAARRLAQMEGIDTAEAALERQVLRQGIESAEQQNTLLLSKFIRERSTTGRDLNALKILAHQTMDPVIWRERAARALRERGLEFQEAVHGKKIQEIIDSCG